MCARFISRAPRSSTYLTKFSSWLKEGPHTSETSLGQTPSLRSKGTTLNLNNCLRCGFACPTNYNPADHYLQVLAVVPGQEEASHIKLQKVCDEFDSSERGLELAKTCSAASSSSSTMPTSKSSPYKASWWEQFTALLWRSWLSIVKDPLILRIRIGTSIVSNFGS